MKATGPGDVSVKLRNKAYAAINRVLDRPACHPVLVQSWMEATEKDKKFSFLQQHIADPSCATLVATESHRMRELGWGEVQFAWMTKAD